MKVGLFPGTFDPPTLGHLDIIQRAAEVCDTLYVALGINSAKDTKLFTIEERIDMLKTITKHLKNVKVLSFSTLVVDFAKENDVNFLVRGLRAFSDFEFETRMAITNRKISGIETIFLLPDEKVAHISSSLIRELGHFKNRLLEFIPAEIEEIVFKKLSAQ